MGLVRYLHTQSHILACLCLCLRLCLRIYRYDILTCSYPPTHSHTQTLSTNHHPQKDDPALLFALCLLATRLATPAPFPSSSTTAAATAAANAAAAPAATSPPGDLGWEAWGWETTASPSPALAIPRSLEGLCALPASALREGGAYASWYRRAVLGALCFWKGRGESSRWWLWR